MFFLPNVYLFYAIIISDFGIFGSIRTDRACNLLYRKYLCLPLIPAKSMVDRVRSLRSEIKLSLQTKHRKGFRMFHRYIKRYWLAKVRPERISVFGKSRRTNNGLEQIHAQMSKKLSTHAKFFRFMDELEKHIFVPSITRIIQTKGGAGKLSVQSNSVRDRQT